MLRKLLVIKIVILSSVYCQASQTRLLSQIETNGKYMRSLIGGHTMHIAYNHETLKFYNPIEISDTQTTALVELDRVFVQNSETGKTTAKTKTTSYSAELNLAYEINMRSVDAWFGANRSRIIETIGSTAPLVLSSRFEPSSEFEGTHRLSLFYDGEISTGLLQYKNVLTGIVRDVALTKPGNALSLFVFSPIHAYAAKLDPQKTQIDYNQDTPTVTQGRSTYTFLPQHDMAIGELKQNTSRYEIHTSYSDFRTVSGSNLVLPFKIVESKTQKDTGQLLTRSVITYTEIQFFPNSEAGNDLFEITIPANAEYKADPLLHGSMMQQLNRESR